MMIKLALLATTASLAFTGCTISTSTSDEIEPTNLSGFVSGQSWNFVAGHTDSFLSEGEDDFFATLYPASFSPCGFSEPNTPHIIVSIPKTVGDYDMGFSRNMTFVDGSSNKVSFDGRIRVDEVTPTYVRGGLVGSYDFDNEVSGTFQITVCND